MLLARRAAVATRVGRRGCAWWALPPGDEIPHSFPDVPSLTLRWQPQSPDEEYKDTKAAPRPRRRPAAGQMVVTLRTNELGISEVEREFLESLAGSRVIRGRLKLVSRLDAGFEENESKLSGTFEKLLAEAKRLAVAHPKGLVELEDA